MHTVFGFVPHIGLRIVNHIGGHLFAALCGQAVHEERLLFGSSHHLALDGRAHNIACSQIDIGNAATEMTTRMVAGIIQPRGDLLVEDRMDVNHVADMVVHIANLPLETNVLFTTIMATKMPLVGRG